jgi:signal transduction histidine kinase
MTQQSKITKSHDKQIVDALYRVNRFLSEVTDLHRLLDLVMEESKQIVDAEASSLMIFDKDTNELYFEVALGQKAKKVKNIRLPLGEGIAGAAGRERKTIVVEDCSNDVRFFKEADVKSRFVTRNIIATPLIRQKRLIGVLEVLNKRPKSGKTFSKQDMRILQFFADQAAIAIENAQLIRANLEAERLAALGQAIAGISHYVKNILTSAMGSTSLIDMGMKSKDFNLIQNSWPILKRSNDTIWNLVQDMLSYSKERKPELQLGNLNQLLEDILQLCQQSAQDNRIELFSELDSHIPLLLFDENRLRDAILNLVNNAMDACKGKPNVQVKIISIFHPKEKKIEIRVKDNGTGIPLEIQKKIFEPFFSTKGNKGTGLGLAITRKAIEEHSGSISLQSEEGVGTTFIIQLPYLQSPKKQNKS